MPTFSEHYNSAGTMQHKKFLFIILLVAVGAVSAVTYYFWYRTPDLTLYGNVDIREVNVGFRVFGRLEQLKFEEGDAVTKGQLLAELDQVPFEDEVNAAKADVAEKKAAVDNADRILARKQRLLSTKFTSNQEYDDAKASRDEAQARLVASKARLENTETQLLDTHVYAPASGTVITRAREPGSVIQAGETVYVISLLEPMWVRAYISETDLGKIAPGDPVLIYTDSHEQPFEGQIGFVSPTAEFTPKNVETKELRANLVYRLRIAVKNPTKYLRQGMPVTIHLQRKS